MFTVVQHSGYGYAGNPQFKAGLESRMVHGAEVARVRDNDGVLFDDYLDAEEWLETEQYPPGAGACPRAPGTFADYEVDGLRVYVPVKTPLDRTEELRQGLESAIAGAVDRFQERSGLRVSTLAWSDGRVVLELES